MLLLTLLLALADWPTVTADIHTKIPRVEIRKGESTGVCSSVVVAIDKDGFCEALTAAHCVEKQPTEHIDITVNGRNAVVLKTNGLLDLAVLRFRAKKETPIELGAVSPPMGTTVAIVGYAFGSLELVAQFGHVAQPVHRESKATLLDAMIAFGDSGGGAIDESGRLIGINSHVRFGGEAGQMAHLAGIVPIESIRDFLDDLREEQKKAERK